MKLSSEAISTLHDDTSSKQVVEYRYDVKLEVNVKPGSGPVAIVAIFHDLVQRMKKAVEPDKPLVVLTATDQLFFDTKEMTSDEFQNAFKVDKIDGKTSRVMMGFKLRTMTTLYEIKQRLMKTYLIPHDLFLREHVGGFQHGIKNHNYGFLQHDHPDHPDIAKLNTKFETLITHAWQQLDKADRNQWKADIPQAFKGETVVIPINFSKERITADMEGKPKIITNAVMISTPIKYGKLLRTLLDISILGKYVTNLIPFGLQREDPAGYYHLLADQERFMEQHRNIPIMNVPNDGPNQKGVKGETLDQVLSRHKHIQRVAYDPKNRKYHISTHAPRYQEVHKWISATLAEHKFPFDPSVRPMKYAGNKGSQTTYSKVLADAISSANESYDASTIKTTRSNAWKQRPPLDISYVPTAEAFPPLPRKTTQLPTATSTMSETLDEDTIQSAISSAIKSIQEQHRAELQQLKQEMQKKIDAMENQMQELGKQIVLQTYQSLVTDESPLVTKIDHANLQHEMSLITTQLSQLINMFSNANSPVGIPLPSTLSPPRNSKRLKQNRTPEKTSFHRDPFIQDSMDTSATSDPDEGVEGCED